jgi:hypothetical protein
MNTRACWPFLLFAACSGSSTRPAPPQQVTKADPCEAAVDKLIAAAKRRSGHELGPDQREAAIEECRQAPESERTYVSCINSAGDDDAIAACMEPPPPKGEPAVELARLVQQLRTLYFIHEKFPTGSVALTPSQPCCSFPNKKCSSAGQWTDPMWKLLEFDLKQEHDYQYRYEATDNKAIIEAIGDPRCDGKTLTYRREMEFRDDGNMHITVLDPPAGSD